MDSRSCDKCGAIISGQTCRNCHQLVACADCGEKAAGLQPGPVRLRAGGRVPCLDWHEIGLDALLFLFWGHVGAGGQEKEAAVERGRDDGGEEVAEVALQVFQGGMVVEGMHAAGLMTVPLDDFKNGNDVFRDVLFDVQRH